MSITNADLIADALRELNVISEIQTPSAEQYAHALRKLNQMMARWLEDGIDLGYFPQTSPSDDCPVNDYAELGVTLNLAIAVASNYGATVSPELGISAENGYATILRTAMNAALPVNEMLTRPRSSGDGYMLDITTL
jgi:tail accessory factor